MKVVLLGPPGAGKGTLAAMVKEDFGAAHISTGDMLRQEMEKGSQLGQDIKRFIETGALVPDAVVIKLIENRLTQDPTIGKGFFLDGFPRTQNQAEDLDKILVKVNKPLDYAVYMEASLPVIIQRLTGRRVCKKCGALFHIVNKKPQKEKICDVCGGPLYQRSDDNEETIKNRMKVYMDNTAPLLDYYQKQKKLKTFNADSGADKACSQFMAMVNEDKSSNKNKDARRN